jgi:3-deoxy-manno-octulosonate cytidylyltransferase (CMP-KDO synthetase)
MAASRFPGKPLALIAGLPMVEHIRRRALLSPVVSEVVVATCDTEIVDAVESFGGRAIMTSDRHERCTERVAEAATGLAADIVVTVQGDEPLLFPESIELAAKPLMEASDVSCVSLLSPLESEADFLNPNIVKAACGLSCEVLFLSRAPVPFFQKQGTAPVHRETGIRALRAKALQDYTKLPESPLERIESIDMLRLLEHGRRILGVMTSYATMGVDHEADITAVEKILQTDESQRSLLERTMSA